MSEPNFHVFVCVVPFFCVRLHELDRLRKRGREKVEEEGGEEVEEINLYKLVNYVLQ